MAIIIGIFVLIIYLACPLMGKIALLAVNTFVPDPIPFVDEIIMWVGLLQNIGNATKVTMFIKEHKFLSFLILVIAVICVFAII